jgi:DNA repair exonuclease SbcCD nuclease subunit
MGLYVEGNAHVAIKFIHTADWHIGKRFADRSEAVRSLLQRARLEQVSTLADVARRHGARIVLVGGDIFDSTTTADQDVRATLAKLRTAQDLTWFLIPGNHDAAVAGGVWDRVQAFGVPENVRLLLTSEPLPLSPEAMLLPAPLLNRQQSHDPTAVFDGLATPVGQMRIGLAHGSVQRFGSGETAAASEIDLSRADRAGLDYLALGDWHGTRSMTPRTWYAGTPEVDRSLDNNAGNCLVVTLDGPRAVPRVETVHTSIYAWTRIERVLRTQDDINALTSLAQSVGDRASKTVLELVLTGEVSRRALGHLEAIVERIGPEFLDLSVEQRGVTGVSDNLDLNAVTSQGVRQLLDDLTTTEKAALDPEARAVAQRAIERVFAFAESGPVARGAR